MKLQIKLRDQCNISGQSGDPGFRIAFDDMDPARFMKDGLVDPVSLAMSFEGNADERIEGAIEEYLEDYSW